MFGIQEEIRDVFTWVHLWNIRQEYNYKLGAVHNWKSTVSVFIQNLSILVVQ